MTTAVLVSAAEAPFSVQRSGTLMTFHAKRCSRITPPRWKMAELVSHADELDLLVVAAHRLLLDVAEAGDVELALGDARVELGGRLLGEQGVLKGTSGHGQGPAASEDSGLVLRMLGV